MGDLHPGVGADLGGGLGLRGAHRARQVLAPPRGGAALRPAAASDAAVRGGRAGAEQAGRPGIPRATVKWAGCEAGRGFARRETFWALSPHSAVFGSGSGPLSTAHLAIMEI